MLKANRPFMALTACFVLNFAALSLISGMVPYYFEYYLEQKELQSIALGLVFGMAALSIPVWVWISKRTSKKRVYVYGGIIYAAALAGIFFLPKENLFPLFVLFAFQGIGAGSSAFAGWAMLPDTVEYGEWKTGVRAEGSVYGVYGVFFKLGIGVGIWLASTGLAYFGYVANVVQTETAAEGIRMLQTLVPAILVGLSLAAVSFYPLTPRLYANILEELDSRKGKI
jgi:GPH family glycoside/pentoside/hexuronide:cation symporter